MKHKKTKAAALILALLLILLAGAGGVLAYFTTEGRATNVITTGTVDLQLTGMGGRTEDGTGIAEITANVMPGTAVELAPVIRNVGTAAFYTRAKVTVTVTGADKEPLPAECVEITVPDGWTLSGGWYYYTQALAPAGEAPLFDGLAFDRDMGNQYQGCTVTVTVAAQGVQVKNNEMTGTDVTSIKGWPAEPQL